MLFDKSNCLAFENVGQLKTLLQSIFKNETDLKKMAANAMSMVKENYDFQIVLEKLMLKIEETGKNKNPN